MSDPAYWETSPLHLDSNKSLISPLFDGPGLPSPPPFSLPPQPISSNSSCTSHHGSTDASKFVYKIGSHHFVKSIKDLTVQQKKDLSESIDSYIHFEWEDQLSYQERGLESFYWPLKKHEKHSDVVSSS